MSGTLIAKYNAARRALAAAKNVDDVKKILVVADGLIAAARRASERASQIEYSEFRIRAIRRLGQMMDAQRRGVGLAKGGRPAKTGSQSDPVSGPVSFRQAGIGKHLADDARKWAAMSEEEFEAYLAKWHKEIEVANKRITVTLTRPRAAKWKQLSLFDTSQLALSGSGRRLERLRQKNVHAPDWLKLTEASDSIIKILAEGIRKLEKIVARIDKRDGVACFQKEFNAMEARVAELVEQYWRLRNFIAELESAGISIQPEPEPEYDPELERRGLWPPDAHKDTDEDACPF